MASFSLRLLIRAFIFYKGKNPLTPYVSCFSLWHNMVPESWWQRRKPSEHTTAASQVGV